MYYKVSTASIVKQKAPTYDADGKVVDAGYVIYMNDMGARCVMTHTLFYKTYSKDNPCQTS